VYLERDPHGSASLSLADRVSDHTPSGIGAALQPDEAERIASTTLDTTARPETAATAAIQARERGRDGGGAIAAASASSLSSS